MIHRDIENPWICPRMEVHREQALGAGAVSRSATSLAVIGIPPCTLPVLAAVAVVGNYPR